MNTIKHKVYKLTFVSSGIFLALFLLFYIIKQVYFMNYVSIIFFFTIAYYIKTRISNAGIYVGYCLLVWTFTPLLRRIFDYLSVWNPNSVIMLLPFLVASLVIPDFLKSFKLSLKVKNLAVIITSLGILYGFIVGFLFFNPLAAIYDLLNWLIPVIFAGYIVLYTKYDIISRSVINTFALISLITGIYGIVQYIFAPPWDTYWLINSKLTSMGRPFPQEIRVWSTLNSAGIYAVFAMCGIMLSSLLRNKLAILAIVVSVIALLLSLVRTAWIGLVLAFLIFLMFQKPVQLIRTIVVTSLITFGLGVMVSQSELYNNISQRFVSLGNVKSDGSFLDRTKTYSEQTQKAIFNVVGDGLGSTGLATKLSSSDPSSQSLGGFDSGLLNIANSLGWFGGSAYFVGLVIGLIFSFPRSRSHAEILVYFSLAVVCIFQLTAYSSQVGSTGFLLWLFLALAISGNQKHGLLRYKAKFAEQLERRRSTA